LSGGEAQRLVIARAIATAPLVMVADEPTAALDRQSRDHIIALFRQLMEEQAMVLVLLTHDPEVASALADECYTLGDGRLLPFQSAEPNETDVPAWI
jgi:ABC-type glutathione transport system ATPase component